MIGDGDSRPMNTIFGLPEKIKQSMLYLATSLSMIISGYFHLDFAAQGIRNIRLEDIYNAWPVISLSISVLLLAIGAAIVFPNPRIAARIALVGAVFGWVYYVLFICSMFLLVSILIFTWPKGLIMFLPQCVLLSVTTNSARRILRKEE
jgi:hypothetical protein